MAWSSGLPAVLARRKSIVLSEAEGPQQSPAPRLVLSEDQFELLVVWIPVGLDLSNRVLEPRRSAREMCIFCRVIRGRV